MHTLPDTVSRWIDLHGHPMHFLEAGRRGHGPTVVLLHGLGSRSETWAGMLPLLGRRAHVIAPDLLGCGASAKPRAADYSVGAHAARVRDLLQALGLDRAGIVGHSFGGGVAISFAYQFPERITHLGLIASGGLGPELTVALRAASLPGAVHAANVLVGITPRWLRRLSRTAACQLGLAGDTDLDTVGRALHSLADPAARQAFLRTVRGAVDWSGQRLAATDHLYLLTRLPVLLVAGRHDTCIPHRHTLDAHRRLAHGRVEILDAGHFPHTEHPDTVARLVAELLATSGAAVQAA